MKSILITVCLSNDMIAPLEKFENLPNSLHVGYYETTRLLGEKFSNGPLINFLKSCHETDSKNLTIIHTRDWHNPNDPLQKFELLKFGSHCIENTYGAKFIWEDKSLISYSKNKPIIFNSKKIMTTLEPDFIKIIKEIIGNTPKEQIKIGIVGVLTNIKVLQMAIGLQGIFDINNIAVCSCLTASNNIKNHFEGLDQLNNIYGINVFNSIHNFKDWLKIKSINIETPKKFNVPEIIKDKKIKLSKEQIDIIEHLFKECKSLKLSELTGGFSGSKVFLIQGTERNGTLQLPCVIKIDKNDKIGKERIGFEKIESILGPHVPKLVDYLELENEGGIRYSLAMMNRADKPKTFREFYSELDKTNDIGLKKLEKVLNILIDEIFTPTYSNFTLDQKQLWASNTFLNDCDFVRESIKKVLGYKPISDKIILKGIGEFYNPYLLYNSENLHLKIKTHVNYVRLSLTHGDLNTSNILLDNNLNIWLIDFANTDYNGYILQDIAKLENDLKFMLTPINSIKDLKEAIALEKILNAQTNFSINLPKLPSSFSKKYSYLYLVLKKLRSFAYQISNDSDITPYKIALLNYAGWSIGGLSLINDYQRKFALVSTSLLSEYLQSKW